MKKILKSLMYIILSSNMFASDDILNKEYKLLDKILPCNLTSIKETSTEKIKEFINKYNIKVAVTLRSGLGVGPIYISLKMPNKSRTYAIDTWENPETSYLNFLSNVIHNYQHRKVIPIRENAIEAAKKLNIFPGLVYIASSDKDKESIYLEIKAWYRKLKPGGIICGEGWECPISKNKIEQAAKELDLTINYTHNFWWFNPKVLTLNHNVDDILNKKVILCTGPAYGRKNMLIETINKDLTLVPYKKIFIATQDPNNMDLEIDNPKISCTLYEGKGKQLDCSNSIINSIKLAAKDPECQDDDIIVFKHESIYINDMNLIKRAINKMMEGYDMIVRRWTGYPELETLMNRSGIINGFYMTNVFLIKVSTARKLFINIYELNQLTNDYHFCEEYFTKHIVKKIPNVYSIDFFGSTWKDNELGFYHIPRYEEDPSYYWNKENYDELYL